MKVLRRRTLLLPISIGSESFRTDLYKSVLSSITEQYDSIVFFIADRLQLYNRAIADHEKLGPILSQFFRGNDYLDERKRWLARLSKGSGLEWIAGTKIIGIDEISDLAFTRILRNVNLLHASDENFREDVDDWARSYVQTLDIPTGFAVAIRQRLSVGFVLEEIACNIRLRVLMGLDDELYPGAFPKALLRLYEVGRYVACAEELALVPVSARKYRFLSATRSRDSRDVIKGRTEIIEAQP